MYSSIMFIIGRKIGVVMISENNELIALTKGLPRTLYKNKTIDW